MGSILNGIALHGPTLRYGVTFLMLSEYMRPAIRLGSQMGTNVIYVLTHDSIGLGEDGPTHQPVEQITGLRSIPGVSVFRPADANETVACWKAVVQDKQGPKALALSRQNLPVLAGTKEKSAEGVRRGGYVLQDCEGTPDVVLIGTGSEVYLAVKAAEMLMNEGIKARVVSMPCLDWFEQQDDDYQNSVVPRDIKARVSVEAGLALSWWKILVMLVRLCHLNILVLLLLLRNCLNVSVSLLMLSLKQRKSLLLPCTRLPKEGHFDVY